ncbi:hypothetical protein DV096_18405 [Bradymonadaceae bacterium TMQ3]|nr:hypothetical protein DV096_18405 [Bradymonadaceae bacterium TMQ3]
MHLPPRALVLVILFAAACGGTETPDITENSSSPPVVAYTITENGVTCVDATQSSESGIGCDGLVCQWICAEHEDAYPVNALFTFQQCPGEPWELTSEFIQNADPAGCRQIRP